MPSVKNKKRANKADVSEAIEEAEQDVSGDDVYTVEKILDRKLEGRDYKYLIKWYGWPKNQATWEPRENLQNISELLKEFDKERDQKDKVTKNEESGKKEKEPKKRKKRKKS